MSAQLRTASNTIKLAREENPKMRERDLAQQLGISEAEFIEAWLGDGVTKIGVNLDSFFSMLRDAGPVMALSRNAGAVHEKTGVYENYRSSKHASMLVGPEIDLRIFPQHWQHAYHVSKLLNNGDEQNSFQFFDTHGRAVHKVYALPQTDMAVWHQIMNGLVVSDPMPGVFKPIDPYRERSATIPASSLSRLHREWSDLQDTHSFAPMLRRLKIGRLDAIRFIGKDYATRLAPEAVEQLLGALSTMALPVMVFVRNPGILQIHSGPVKNIKKIGPWLNVLDEGFHCHLRVDQIDTAWIVRKPAKRGDIYSVELFDQFGEQIMLINGFRREGDQSPDLEAWNQQIQSLPQKEMETPNAYSSANF
ncbi:MAG: ChuX/HutX family heme-like substrate-binding protein [Pseudomonadota bacterium]